MFYSFLRKYLCFFVLLYHFLGLNAKIADGMEIRSGAFNDGGIIPQENTGFGEDISPDLYWRDIPVGTDSFALIMDDPDATVGIWVHWVIYNIPGDVDALRKNIKKILILDDHTMQGVNSFNSTGYDGPYPPPGPPHRYIFKLYALDTVLDLKPGATKEELEKSMRGHVLDEASLTGIFKR